VTVTESYNTQLWILYC